MSALSEFQQNHGAAWGQIVGSAAFGAALALANAEKIREITQLGDDEIAKNASVILSDLRGHLKYEAALIGLHEKKEFVFQELGPEEYVDPQQEAYEQSLAENRHSDEGKGPPIFSMPSAAPEPRPAKKRRRPSGKGKRKK